MSERNPFEAKGPGLSKNQVRCDQWEDLLADALDGALPAGDRAAFDEHSASCATCGQLLTESQQGREWLRFLEAEPEIPSDLVERILSKTSGSAVRMPVPALAGAGAAVPVHLLGVPVRRVMWDSRMLMTVAMAFFSIALTLNLAGVRFTNLKLADLTPASMETNLTHQFYTTKKSMVQYYDNLRLVYEVESKVREMRRTEEMQRQDVPANPRDGHKNGGRLVRPEGPLSGHPVLASTDGARADEMKQEMSKAVEENVVAEPFGRVAAEQDQAKERSLA